MQQYTDINGIGDIGCQYDVPQVDEATIYCTAGKATDDNMTHAHCMLVAKGYKHTLSIRIILLFHCSNGCASLLRYTYMYIACLVLKIMASSFGYFHVSFAPSFKVPYFSIDNAHLMYNAHPKLFRHSFWCIDNVHDVFFDR